MIEDIELHSQKEDYMENVGANVIAIADDVAPCAAADNPRDVIHRMQLLLNIVEDHGIQNHIQFGTDKCKLLISARPGKIKAVEALLKEEPGILTFFDRPVNLVDDFYVHIGVPQSPRNQSRNAVDYCIKKGENMTYKLQASTLNSLCGVSPLSNRKMFLSYHQPSFLYGLDTMHVNTTDISKLETKYRHTLKHMLSLPDCVSSPLVYLTMGILPATAQRDLEILGLLGQLGMCDQGDQNVRASIEHNLAFFDDKFAGWSAVVRKTALEYGLPDPLQYLQHPWRPDRWRSHCRTVITEHWDHKLRAEAEPRSSSDYADLSSLSTTTPMRIWQQAGLSSQAVKHATIASWMYCGTYFTRELLHKMHKSKSPSCACNPAISENIPHVLLYCELYDSIRQECIPKFIGMNNQILQISDDEKLLVISILDPLSSKLPETITSNWTSVTGVYQLARNFCHRIHLKREKIYMDLADKT